MTRPSSQTQSRQSILDASTFVVSDDLNPELNPLRNESISVTDIEKNYVQLYTDALKYLSPTSNVQSPAQAFQKFEFIARQGQAIYSKLSPLCQTVVSFAQYRTGLMLCMSSQDNEELGNIYLCLSSENGNAHAKLLLGQFAEREGKLNAAEKFYYEAGCLGLACAKLAYGILVFFKKTSVHSEYNKAIRMLTDISNEGNTFASLALTLYYEKMQQFPLALEYASRFKASPGTSIYCVGYNHIGIVFLKAGREYATSAYHCIKKSAEGTYIQDGKREKYTPSLRILATFYLMGVGTHRDPEVAFNLINEAAMLGDEAANVILAQFYQSGIGCPVNLQRAMLIYQNYPDNIAAKLSRGLILKTKNPRVAYEEFKSVLQFRPTPFDESHWNIKSIKHEAAVQIALWQFNGIGGAEHHPEKAFRTLQMLADEENFDGAHYWVGWAYLEGVRRTDGTVLIEKDQKDEAFRYFAKGSRKPECLYLMGKMLKEGYSTPNLNKNNAFDFFLKAANKNYFRAYVLVGASYYSGAPGTNGRDLQKALDYFLAAAKHDDPLAIQYLADYIIKDKLDDRIDRLYVYNQLNHSAAQGDLNAYRMLGLLVNSGIDPSHTYENSQNSHPDLLSIYNLAREEAIRYQTDIKFRFTLHCLWKAMELEDVSSGQHIIAFSNRMSPLDQKKTVDIFEKITSGGLHKMSLPYAKFLAKCEDKSSAIKMLEKIALYNDMTCSLGWNSRIEVAKIVLLEHQGKATIKSKVFKWLSEMVTCTNGKNLLTPFILLAKCHDMEICSGCKKEASFDYYEKALQFKLSSTDRELEIAARMRLIERFYDKKQDVKLEEQLKETEKAIDQIRDPSEKRNILSKIYYYKGLIALHNGTLRDYRSTAEKLLLQSERLGNVFATLELGYLYGTMEGCEDKAEYCFQKAEISKQPKISFKNRVIESGVQHRSYRIRNSSDYLKEINKMKLAAGIAYSYYNMERQALDWFNEISDEPFAKVMILYYKLKDVNERKPHYIRDLSDLTGSLETQILDYYGNMTLSYGQFRLGQCYEHGHGVPVDKNKVLEYYNKASAHLNNNEIYERLAEILSSQGSDVRIFRTLYNASRNDIDATFKLAQFYHKGDPNPKDPDVPPQKAADHYYTAAQAGHAEACYYYAKFKIDQISKKVNINPAHKSRKAAVFLQRAAEKNHGPSYYELGKLEMDAGMYSEGFDDLQEASFLRHGPATYHIAEMKEKGFNGFISNKVTFRLKPDREEAFKLYKDAYEQGETRALIKLGAFYEDPSFKNYSLEKAREQYLRAYESGKCPEGAAEYALGCLEETLSQVSNISQKSTEKHYLKAFEWFKKALDAESEAAKFEIGRYLVNGYVVVKSREQDIEDGIKILVEVMGSFNVQAMKELAKYYQKIRKEEDAFRHWQKAALFGDPEALEFVAKCYEKGLLGQKINLVKAEETRVEAMEARKKAIESQHSVMGFKSDFSEDGK